MKLGKRDPHPADHKHHSVRLCVFLRTAEPPPPACSWVGSVSSWILGENDQIGDCAIVGPSNAILAWSTSAGAPKRLADADILAAYQALGGWDGIAGDASDGGCVLSDVLAGWADHARGIGGDFLDAFAEVDHGDQDNIRRAIATCGPCIVGLALPTAAQHWGSTWPVILPLPHGYGYGLAPGSWGGHCVAIVAYDADAVTIATWGSLVRVPWPTLAVYLDEAWAVVDCDFISANGTAANGLDLARMIADCQAMRDST